MQVNCYISYKSNLSGLLQDSKIRKMQIIYHTKNLHKLVNIALIWLVCYSINTKNLDIINKFAKPTCVVQFFIAYHSKLEDITEVDQIKATLY